MHSVCVCQSLLGDTEKLNKIEYNFCKHKSALTSNSNSTYNVFFYLKLMEFT